MQFPLKFNWKQQNQYKNAQRKLHLVLDQEDESKYCTHWKLSVIFFTTLQEDIGCLYFLTVFNSKNCNQNATKVWNKDLLLYERSFSCFGNSSSKNCIQFQLPTAWYSWIRQMILLKLLFPCTKIYLNPWIHSVSSDSLYLKNICQFLFYLATWFIALVIKNTNTFGLIWLYRLRCPLAMISPTKQQNTQ